MSTGHIPTPGQMSRYKKVARGEAPRRAHRPEVMPDEPIDMTDLGAVSETSIVSTREARTRRTHNEAHRASGTRRAAVVAATLAAIAGGGALVHALSGENDANADSSPNVPGVVATAQNGSGGGSGDNYGGSGREKIKDIVKPGDVCHDLLSGSNSQVSQWVSLIFGENVRCDAKGVKGAIDSAHVSGGGKKIDIVAYPYNPGDKHDGCKSVNYGQSLQTWRCDGGRSLETDYHGVMTIVITGAGSQEAQADLMMKADVGDDQSRLGAAVIGAMSSD